MGKNRLVLHSAAILAIVFFAFLAISSGASTPAVTSTTVDSNQTSSKGAVYDMKPESKPYDALGLVWASSVTKYDENGVEASSQEGVVILLLREAQKIGGNDIVNLRVDENVTFSRTQEKVGSSIKTVTRKTVTYTGSALAIKYRN
jgi:hypothetical protein